MQEKQFYIVWCEERGEPTKKHTSFQSACAEAKRLAQIHPQHDFVVLKAIQAVKYNAIPFSYTQFSKKKKDFE